MMETELVSKMLVFDSTLMWLIAREDFVTDCIEIMKLLIYCGNLINLYSH
jgi:hypothetical protein